MIHFPVISYSGATNPTKSAAMKLSLGADEGWLTGNSTKLSIAEAYKVVGWIRRAAKIRAGAAADVPFTLLNESGDPVYDVDVPEDGWPDDLMFVQNLRSLVFLMDASLALMGRAAMFKEMENGAHLPLRWFNPTSVKPLVSSAEGLVGVERTVNGRKIRIPLEDLILIMEMDPFNENHFPTSDGDAARVHGDILDSLYEWTDKHLDSGLILKTVWTAEGAPPEPERKRIKEYLTRFMLGKKNADNQAEILSGNLTPHKVGEGFKELSNVDLTKDNREGISTTLGVPHGIMMSNETGARATANQDWVNLYTTTVFPDLNIIEDGLNKQLFNELGYTISFEKSRVEAMQAYEISKAEAVSKLAPGKQIFTVGELREMLGKGGDVPEELVSQPTEPDTIRMLLHYMTQKTLTQAPVYSEPNSTRALPAHTDTALKALQEKKREEAETWKKVAEKKGRDYDFSCDYLTQDESQAIKERLLIGKPMEECFKHPYVVDFM